MSKVDYQNTVLPKALWILGGSTLT